MHHRNTVIWNMVYNTSLLLRIFVNFTTSTYITQVSNNKDAPLSANNYIRLPKSIRNKPEKYAAALVVDVKNCPSLAAAMCASEIKFFQLQTGILCP